MKHKTYKQKAKLTDLQIKASIVDVEIACAKRKNKKARLKRSRAAYKAHITRITNS